MTFIVINKIVNRFYLNKTLGKWSWVWPRFRIPRTKNLNYLDRAHQKNPFYYLRSSFSYELLDFLMEVGQRVSKKDSVSFIRVNDGEMLYLKGNIKGLLVKRQGVPKDLSQNYIEKIREKAATNDYLMLHPTPGMGRDWQFKGKDKFEFTYNSLLIYQAVSTKLLFYILSGSKIGVIGGNEKINLIKNLISFSEYRDYLGIGQIVEYIGVPEIGAASDPEKTKKLIMEKMVGEADVYLFGIGVSKLSIIPELRDETGKIFIDVGAGIDAMAGVINRSRPYFGDWVNFRIEGYDYSEVDIINNRGDFDKYDTKKRILQR